MKERKVLDLTSAKKGDKLLYTKPNIEEEDGYGNDWHICCASKQFRPYVQFSNFAQVSNSDIWAFLFLEGVKGNGKT